MNKLAIFLLVLGMYSCTKTDFSKVSYGKWNPNLAVPIGSVDFDMDEILSNHDNNELVVIDQFGQLEVNYSTRLQSVSAAEVLTLPAVNESVNLSMTDLGIPTIPVFNQTINQSTTAQFAMTLPSGIELHDLILDDGDLAINMSTALKHDVVLTVTFPDIYYQGNPVTRVLTANYLGSTPHGSSASVDLTNHLLDLTAGNTTVNQLRITIGVQINGTGNEIVGNEDVSINFGLNNLKLNNATGYFGQQSLAVSSDSILIKLFNNAQSGVAALTNPKINFKFINSFGIPFQLAINDMKTINVANGVEMNIVNSSLAAINIPSAPSNVDSSITILPEINATNTTNLNNLINNTPKYLSFDVNVTTNPNGNTGPLNFISKDSKLFVEASVALPLEGYAYDFNLKDTMAFNFSDVEDNIDFLLFRLISKNGFPVNLIANATVVDQNYVPLFDLLSGDQELIGAAPVDANGKVNDVANRIVDISVDKSKLLQFKQGKYVVLEVKVATTQPQTTVVKFYNDYKLSLKLAMQAVLNQSL